MPAKQDIISEIEKIELLSEDVQEIMGQVPHWMVRWGITVIFSVVILIVAGSFVFKYPDVISSTVVIISENPSASIVARTSAKIDNIFVQNEKIMKRGEVLAILENSANYQHVFDLKNKLDEFGTFFNSPSNSKPLTFPTGHSLGQVQSAFSNFQRLYSEYLNFLSVDVNQKKIIAIQYQYSDYESYTYRLKNQATNQEKSMQLTRKQFLRDSTLFRGGVIAVSEYEKSEQTFLQVKNAYQGLLASIANTQMQMNQLSYQVIDLESQQMEQGQSRINSLKESFDNLHAVIADWEKVFVLVSPVDGKVAFNRYWSKNQFVTSGETVFTIVPSLPQRILGRAKIPVAGSGKIKVGQRVLVRLDNFPYMEFGMLEGKLLSISQVPETSQQGAFYTAEISFPGGLLTNYKKTLPFQQELQGSAEIITQNLSLFDRLINPFKSAFKQSY